MTISHLPNDEHTPAPAGVNAGPQSGAGGAGGEPKGAALQADARQQQRPTKPQAEAGQHEQHADLPEYQARPAGQSGVGEQDDLASSMLEPQGDGNYLATDHGPTPLRNG